MGMLELSDLKKCRLVCHFWNRHASEAMEKKDHIVSLNNYWRIEEFSRDMGNSFTNIRFFTNFSVTNSLGYIGETLFQDIGSNVKRLEIKIDPEPYSSLQVNNRNVIYLHNHHRPTTPNRYLKSGNVRITFQNIHHILRLTRNLEYLSLNGVDIPEEISYSRVLIPAGFQLTKLASLRIRSASSQ